MDGKPLGLDWPLVLTLATDAGLDRPLVAELLPSIEAGMFEAGVPDEVEGEG